ncbi:MAG: hypothetical protein ACJ78Q_02280 [Chloroflexia bacterium]
MFWNANFAGKSVPVRVRSLVLGLSALLIAYGVAGTSPLAFANSGDTVGSVDIAADSSVVYPGSTVTYTLTVHNGSQAGLVTVTDNLPSHSTLVSAPDCSMRNGSGVECTFAMFAFDVVSTQVTVVIDNDVNCNSQLRDSAHVQGWGPSSLDIEADCYAP